MRSERSPELSSALDIDVPPPLPPGVSAKVGPPRIRLDMVPRPRLVDRLESSPARCVLISAPAGSGKSVVALEWLQRSGGPVAWLSLDRMDTSPDRFVPHFLAALTSGEVLSAGEASAILKGLQTGSWTQELLRRIGMTPRSGIVVLDDVHTLEPGPVMGFLASLLTDLDAGPKVVLLSRTDPPIPIGRLRLSGELLEIRQDDLRFTGAEVSELFRRSLGVDLDPDMVRRLEARTEGWAAGLRLTALALRRAPDPMAAAEEMVAARDLILEYLMEEAVAGQPADLQRFLLDTSILTRFTADTCVQVTGDRHAVALLQQVEDENLFLISMDRESTWYRYHHLFGELLRQRLDELNPDRRPVLHRRASRWYEEQGDIQEALRHAAQVDDPGRLVELLDRHGYDILARSEFAGYARWLPFLSEPLAHRSPMFLVSLAWFRAQTERQPALGPLLSALDEALERPPPDYPPPRLEEARLHRSVLESFVLRVTDRFRQAIDVGESLLAELSADETRIRGIVRFNLGAVHLRLADMAAARRHLSAAYDDCLHNGLPYLVLASRGHLGAVAAQTTGLAVARSELEATVAYAEAEGLAGIPAFGIVLYQLAQVRYLADDLGPARELLERALEITAGERETDIHANVLIHLARVSAALDDLDAAEESLRRGAALVLTHNVKPFATTMDVERARLTERSDGHLQRPEEAPPSAEPFDGWSTLREAEAVFRLEQSLKLGIESEVRRLADLLERKSAPRGRGVALTLARVAHAVSAGDTRTRRQMATKALSMAASRGYVRPLLDGGPSVHALIRTSLEYPELPSHVRSFVRSELLPRILDGPTGGSPTSDATEITPRERDVLLHLARGLTNAELSRALFVSGNTVKTHLKHIYAKLGASNRTEAVKLARSRGLLPSED